MTATGWPYMNWQHLLTAGVKPWANDEMPPAEADLFLLRCRNNIEAVLWSVLMAAETEAQS